MKNKKTLLAAILSSIIIVSSFTSCVGDSGMTDESSYFQTEIPTESLTEGSTEGPTEGLTEDSTEADTEEETSSSGTPVDPDTIKSYINPRFSLNGGLYSDPQTLELSLPSGYEDYLIYYTTDGSVPTRASEKYTSPISILADGGSVVIRAACFAAIEEEPVSDGTDNIGKIDSANEVDAKASGNLEEEEIDAPVGKVVTHTYIHSENISSTLWTVAITAEDPDFTMLVNNYSESIEIPSHTEIITPEGKTVISQDTGLRIFGGSSRSLIQKSFKVIARSTEKLGNDIYNGKGSFSYPLFENRTIRSGKGAGEVLEKYDSFILRNGGNDSLQSTAQDKLKPNLLRDGLSNRFAAMMTETFDYANSQFAAVYINGEYYGLLDMRENMNEDYVKNVYGVDDDDVVILKSELDTSRPCSNRRHINQNGAACRFCGSWFYYETDEEYVGYIDEWKELCQKAINANDKNFDEIFAEIESKVDLDSLAEYVALNLYLSNTDWPHNNIKLWKYIGDDVVDGIEVTDGKWRFMYRDMDFTMGRYNVPEALAELNTVYSVDTFYRMLGNYKDFGVEQTEENRLYPDPLYIKGLFDFCLKNEAFKENFIDICGKMSSAEGEKTLLDLLNEMVAEVEPGMSAHLERWQGTYSSRYNMDAWYASINEMKEYIDLRPDAFNEHLNFAMSLYSKSASE